MKLHRDERGPKCHRPSVRLVAALGTVLALIAVPACSSSGSGKATLSDKATRSTGVELDQPERVVSVPGSVGPGPAFYNETRVLEVGAKKAKNVLVLEPGTSAGAPSMRLDAHAIAKAMPDWQVWSIDRRENLFEDHAMTDNYILGVATAKEAFDYYLGWLSDPKITPHFQAVPDATAPFAREWGMDLAINDLQKVITKAKGLGGKVVLGGHSLGGSIATAYATWDFNGKSGGDDLDGLVLIDGASGPGAPISVEDANARKASLATSSPFIDLVGLGLPWAAGVFNVLGSNAALLDPDKPSLAYNWPLFPAMLKPPVAPSNRAQYGYALDTKTGPESLKLVQMHIGELAESGSPRGWKNDGISPVERAATTFAGIQGMDGTSWYHPAKLSLDAGAVNGGIENPAGSVLNVHATHGKDLKVPIYAFATSLGNQRVLDAASALAAQANLPAEDLTLVDRISTYADCDPLAATPSQNDFLKTVQPFLAKIG